MKNFVFSKTNIYLIILFSFFISIIVSFNYISKYDEYRFAKDLDRMEHPMIKVAIFNQWFEANKLLEDLKNGKNYFESGSDYDEFLPHRILATFYTLINEKIFEKDEILKTNNGKFLYLIFKTLLYYLSLIFLFSKIKSLYPVKTCFFIILFLSCEPTIFQYHSSFWNESLFFPFQIIMMSLLLSQSSNFLDNLILGLALGIMYTISQEVFFYFVPIIFYLIFTFKKKSIKPIFAFFIGYFIIMATISFHNYKRVGNGYFMTNGSKTALYLYFAPNVLSIKENISIYKAQNKMHLETKIWLKENDLNLEFINDKFSSLGKTKNDSDRLMYYNYLSKASLDIIIKNPISTLNFLIKKNLHTLVVDPFFIKNFYKYDSRGKNQYYYSQTYQKNIPYRILYTVLIYLVAVIGFFYLLKHPKKELILILTLLIIYPIFVLGWMGANRYFVPSLIFLSIFFGNGISTFFKSSKP